uniref:Uncharacterized protein n=1 Tax=Palpitomonas bilix TaxID=652834 RepID=A0A7S3GBT3_9EUKA|mmetsp:Transcript_41002/g.106131  ORF Transcript_41002/g.106131 Transcript_41002/m.106131 type:complete len:125 (+) Transcript_41002:250-624(+)
MYLIFLYLLSSSHFIYLSFEVWRIEHFSLHTPRCIGQKTSNSLFLRSIRNKELTSLPPPFAVSCRPFLPRMSPVIAATQGAVIHLYAAVTPFQLEPFQTLSDNTECVLACSTKTSWSLPAQRRW